MEARGAHAYGLGFLRMRRKSDRGRTVAVKYTMFPMTDLPTQRSFMVFYVNGEKCLKNPKNICILQREILSWQNNQTTVFATPATLVNRIKPS